MPRFPSSAFPQPKKKRSGCLMWTIVLIVGFVIVATNLMAKPAQTGLSGAAPDQPPLMEQLTISPSVSPTPSGTLLARELIGSVSAVATKYPSTANGFASSGQPSPFGRSSVQPATPAPFGKVNPTRSLSNTNTNTANANAGVATLGSTSVAATPALAAGASFPPTPAPGPDGVEVEGSDGSSSSVSLTTATAATPTPTPIPTPAVPTRTPTPTPPATSTPPPPSVSSLVAPPVTGILLRVTGTSPGRVASAQVDTAPNTSCTIIYSVPSGRISTAQGLEPKTTDYTGHTFWSWLISGNTGRGTGSVTVTCGGQGTVTQPIVIG